MPIKPDEQIRSNLNEKIKREAKRIYDLASSEDLTSFHSEVEIKYQICNELYNIFMSDEMVQALMLKDNALDDAYRFYLEENRDNQVFLAVSDYLEKEERSYLADKLYDRVKAEYDEHLGEVKTWPPEKIIDEAYKLTILYDFMCSLDSYLDATLSTERLKALLSLDNPLWSMYQEWMRSDYSHMDDIRDVIMQTADERVSEMREKSVEADHDLEDEDELEL